MLRTQFLFPRVAISLKACEMFTALKIANDEQIFIEIIFKAYVIENSKNLNDILYLFLNWSRCVIYAKNMAIEKPMYKYLYCKINYFSNVCSMITWITFYFAIRNQMISKIMGLVSDVSYIWLNVAPGIVTIYLVQYERV